VRKNLARIIPIFRPSARKIAVAAIANKAYDQGWADCMAQCLAEHHAPAAVS